MTRGDHASTGPPAPLLRLADLTWPSRDQSLAQVVAALSGPATGPPADNLLSNEDSAFRVADRVARDVPLGGVWLGVGPDQNFALMAPARPCLALIVDFRRRNALLHLLHRALMLLSPTRSEYLARLLARDPAGPVPPESTATAEELARAFAAPPLSHARLDAEVRAVAEVLQPLNLVRPDEWPALASLQRKLAGPGLSGRFLALPIYPTLGQQLLSLDRPGQPSHHLATAEGYAHLRAMQRGDRVIPVVGDLADAATLGRIGGWLRSRSLAVAAFYLSDVEFFLVRSGRYPALASGLAQLPWHEGAVLIRTSTRELPGHPERLPGASSTTVLRPAHAWLKAITTDPHPSLDQLFAPL